MNDKFANVLAARLYDYVETTRVNDINLSTDPPLAPLPTRLQRLLATIPDCAKHQGLVLMELQAQLRGRKGGLPHIGEMGAAMRKLGWRRRRKWSDEAAAFSSKWYPMDQFPTRRGD